MKRSEQEKLLNEILPDDDAADFERTSLEYGLAGLRRERRRGYWMRTSALATICGILALGIVLKQHRPAHGDGAVVAQLASAPTPTTSGQIKIISDDELLALFPGRSVALIGKPGQQRLVFLDKPDSDPARMPF